MLIFIANDLMLKTAYKALKLPLQFIGIGYTTGSMYYLSRPANKIFLCKETRRCNKVVYGALFYCKDFEFYQEIIDGYHDCTFSVFKENHPKAMIHRETQEITMIKFKNLNEFSRLIYEETGTVNALIYYANTKHPKIIARRRRKHRQRILSGVYGRAFREMFWEVENESKN